SVSWPVIGDVSAFVAGIRALLIQAAHPEVVAGVLDHSSFRDDTLGRLSRTSAWVTATTFGAEPEVTAVVATVKRADRSIRGESERGRAYNASNGALGAWVHNALTDSFLTAYQSFGPEPLCAADADRFVAEQAKVGALLEVDPVPLTARDLRDWLTHHPDIERSTASATAVRFLQGPPLPGPVMLGYRPLFLAATATLPPRLAGVLGLRAPSSSLPLGRAAVGALRWSLGTSPTWQRAIDRAEAAPVDQLAN
ncbi:MAG: oxygenase MpaB family protein, partial [Acidimicrobiales bacterium]